MSIDEDENLEATGVKEPASVDSTIPNNNISSFQNRKKIRNSTILSQLSKKRHSHELMFIHEK